MAVNLHDIVEPFHPVRNAGESPENCRFAEALEKKGAAVSFSHWPGDHTWDLWDRSVELALRAFLEK